MTDFGMVIYARLNLQEDEQFEEFTQALTAAYEYVQGHIHAKADDVARLYRIRIASLSDNTHIMRIEEATDNEEIDDASPFAE